MAFIIKAKDENKTTLAQADEKTDAVISHENNWYFTPEIVRTEYLKLTERTYICPYKGKAYWYDLDAPGIKAKNIAWVYLTPAEEYEQIAGRIAFYSRETSGTIAEEIQNEKA